MVAESGWCLRVGVEPVIIAITSRTSISADVIPALTITLMRWKLPADTKRCWRIYMLYKIDYTTRNMRDTGSRFINLAINKTEAVKAFMDWFHDKYQADAVRIDLITEIEFVGDGSALAEIDDAILRAARNRN
jgi:low affinity Fe/Cu permease